MLKRLIFTLTLLIGSTALAAPNMSNVCLPEAPECNQTGSGLGWYVDNTLGGAGAGDLYYLKNGTDWLKITCSSSTCTVSSSQGTTIDFAEIVDVNSLVVDDTLAVTGATALSGAFTYVTHSIGIAFNDMRVHDNLAALLPVAAAADDMGNVPGTVGTTAPSLQGVDFGGTSTDEKATFSFVIPPTYLAGSTVTLRFNAGMITAVSDGTATLDAECWVPDYANADGTVSSDLVTTAAQSINSLTFANKDFAVGDAVSGHALAAGSVVQCRISFAGSDTGNLDVMIPAIRKIDVLITT